MVAMAGVCCCSRSSELWAFESMAGRLTPTSQRAFSVSVSVGLKPLNSHRLGNFSNSPSSSRRSLVEEQCGASRCAQWSALGTAASWRAFYMEGGGKGGRPNSVSAQAYVQSGQPQQQERGEFPRPPIIRWDKDLSNAVQLIGRVGRDITVKYLDSGKVVAHTSLAVKKGTNKNEEPSWFELEIWDALAEVSAHHVEKGEQIFITGRIVVDKNVRDEVSYTNVKVIVRDLCFVEPYNDPRQPYGQENLTNRAASQQNWNQQQSANEPSQGQKESSNEAALATERKWQEYFADPAQWWDNRENKKNPKSPDFKHKSTQEALWINSWNNPPWVAQQLAVLEEKKAQHTGDFDESQSRSQGKRLSSFKDSDLQY